MCKEYVDGKSQSEDPALLARHVSHVQYFMAHTDYQVISAQWFRLHLDSRRQVHSASTEVNLSTLMASQLNHSEIVIASRDHSLYLIAQNATPVTHPRVVAMPAEVRRRYTRSPAPHRRTDRWRGRRRLPSC